METVEKKSVVRLRHKIVAKAMSEWTQKHPHAPLRRKVKHFDFLCDTAYLQQRLKK